MDIAECLFLRRSTFRITKTRGINRRIVFFDLMAMLFDCDEQERIKGEKFLFSLSQQWFSTFDIAAISS